MTSPNSTQGPNDNYSLSRRTILKSAGVMGAASMFGSSLLSRPAAAAPASGGLYQFYSLYPIAGYDGAGKRYVVGYDAAADGSGFIPGEPIELQSNTALGSDFVVTMAFAPDGMLYGINAADGVVFSVNLDTGAVTAVTSAADPLASQLKNTPGSAILPMGDPAVNYLFALTKTDHSLTKVNLDTGTITAGPTLTVEGWPDVTDGTVINDVYGPADETGYHVGLAVDFATETVYGLTGQGTAAESYEGPEDEVTTIDVDTGVVTLVKKDVVSIDTKIGAEFEPCTNTLFAIRNGQTLLSLDVDEGTTTTVGTVYIDADGDGTKDADEVELDTASLASPWPATLECCVQCDLEGALKYEYVYEDEDDDGIPEVDGFVPEDAPDAFGYLGYETKQEDGEVELYEPMTVCFSNPGNYCLDSLAITIKAGQNTTTATPEETEDGFCVAVDGKHAISYVEFTCA